MQVRQGWSGEVKKNQWAKFDVELSEEDLRRLLAVEGLTEVESVSVPLAFQLLEIEAERLVLLKLITRYEYPGEEGRTRLKDLGTARAGILTKIKSGVS